VATVTTEAKCRWSTKYKVITLSKAKIICVGCAVYWNCRIVFNFEWRRDSEYSSNTIFTIIWNTHIFFFITINLFRNLSGFPANFKMIYSWSRHVFTKICCKRKLFLFFRNLSNHVIKWGKFCTLDDWLTNVFRKQDTWKGMIFLKSVKHNKLFSKSTSWISSL